ncbi:hypothetical protein [Actinomadura nitritigenes]|uniref:hypothetical protein n=1 Tax=Actinomadura nitritigenes TaxID=134602 RepID=UPI003D8FB25F
MTDIDEDDFTDHAVHLEYTWRAWRYMLTSATAPALLCVSANGILRLGSFVDCTAAERVFWDVVTLAIQDAGDHLADMRVNSTRAAVVLEGPPDGRAHLAVRSASGMHLAHCYDTSYDALDAWAQMASELALGPCG